MARTRRLTAEEAAERLGLSVSRVTDLARNGDLGRKVAGRWLFSEAEVRRVMREREDRATAITQRKRMERDHRRLQGLPPKRPKPRQRTHATDAPPRSRRPRGVSSEDMGAWCMRDDLLAQERAMEAQYRLPFRAPHQTEMVLHTCTRWAQPLLLLIFGDHATDAEGLLAYGRLMAVVIRQHGVPAYVLSRPVGTGDDAQSLLCRVWPDTGEVIMMTPNHWDAFVMALSQSHECAGTARR